MGDSPILSSARLDSGAEIVFKDSRDEACYASLVLGPMLYVDDLFRIAPSVASAHAGLKKMEQLAASKGVDYNPAKTSYIVVGGRKEKESIEKELEENPLKLYGKEIKQVKPEKYLSWHLHEEGLSASAHEIVMK